MTAVASAAEDALADLHLRLLRDLVSLFNNLVMLENYAVLNHCGFGKILKKHDKVAGWVGVKEAYMQAKVNCEAFATHRRLRRMIVGAKAAYDLLIELSPVPEAELVMDGEEAERFLAVREVKQGLRAEREAMENDAAAAAVAAVEAVQGMNNSSSSSRNGGGSGNGSGSESDDAASSVAGFPVNASTAAAVATAAGRKRGRQDDDSSAAAAGPDGRDAKAVELARAAVRHRAQTSIQAAAPAPSSSSQVTLSGPSHAGPYNTHAAQYGAHAPSPYPALHGGQAHGQPAGIMHAAAGSGGGTHAYYPPPQQHQQQQQQYAPAPSGGPVYPQHHQQQQQHHYHPSSSSVGAPASAGAAAAAAGYYPQHAQQQGWGGYAAPPSPPLGQAGPGHWHQAHALPPQRPQGQQPHQQGPYPPHYQQISNGYGGSYPPQSIPVGNVGGVNGSGAHQGQQYASSSLPPALTAAMVTTQGGVSQSAVVYYPQQQQRPGSVEPQSARQLQAPHTVSRDSP